MTFKTNFEMMAENSHYFEASLCFSRSDTLAIDLSDNGQFYPPDKEESVKLALKLVVHVLHGSSLVNCKMIAGIKDRRVLHSALMICLFVIDRLQIKAKPRSHLFEFIFSHFFINLDSQCSHDEICYAIKYVVRSGCVYLYGVILEIVVNHLKHINANKTSTRINKEVIITIIRNTFAHHDWFGSEMCLRQLRSFICM